MLFADRVDAGKKLAQAMLPYKEANDTCVLGLARGGVIVAAVLAKELKLPLGVVVVRKLGAPENPELAIGAVTDSGERVVNENLMKTLGVSRAYLEAVASKQCEIAKKRQAFYLQNSAPPQVEGQTVILVDDGIATGASIRAAIQSLRARGVKQLVLAVPVAAPDSLRAIQPLVDEAICLDSPVEFYAVGQFYKEFKQVSDEEIIRLRSL